MKNETISVIVPVYKVEPYLRECVDSIINQTYKNLEIILVDDGSPDNCGAICDEYAAQDSRVRVIHKENGGVSSARNAGIEAATGDYIGFVDSDDWIEKDMFETLLTALVNANADMCICNCADETESGERIPTEYPLSSEILSKREVLKRLIRPGGGVYAGVWNKLYKASILKNHRFMVGRRYEDELISHHVINECESVVTISDVLYHYIQRGGSFCNSPYSVKNLDQSYALLDRYRFFKENGYLYEARKTWQAAYGFLLTSLYKLPLKENWAAFRPLVKQIGFQSYLDLRTVKLMLVIAKKWLQETF